MPVPAASLLLPVALATAPALAGTLPMPGAAGQWNGLPDAQVGKAVRIDGDALRLDTTGPDGARVRACQDGATPVKGRVRVQGEWKLSGVVAEKGWHGARVRLKFLDAAGQALTDKEGTVTVITGRGDRDWQEISKVVDVPAGATQVRMCVDLFKSEAGSAWFRGLETPPPSTAGKNVLWILVDTLRADALGAWGGPKGISPRIDALAAESLTFDRAWAQYTWTNPSTVSAFTSQYARTHGWEYQMGKSHLDSVHLMSQRLDTVAEVLQDQGFLTQGWYANGYLKGEIGFSRGFHVWAYSKDDQVLEKGLDDIARWDDDGAPNFLYLHFMTPHVPLRPSAAAQKAAGVSVSVPADGIGYFGQVQTSMAEDAYNAMFRDAYQASVYDADVIVGQILDALKAHGHADDTLVILSSDHGELLGEHGEVGHGNFVYEPLTHVPLLVRAPGAAGKRVTDRVGQVVDIAPTITGWLGVDTPASWQGLDLRKPAPGRTAVSERNALLAVTTDGRWKAIEANDSGKLQEGFDLKTDPAEEKPLGAGVAGVAAAQAAAGKWRKATPDLENDGPPLTLESEEKDDTMQMLQELGYVE